MQIKENAAFIPFNIAEEKIDKVCHTQVRECLVSHTSIFNKIHSSVL